MNILNLNQKQEIWKDIQGYEGFYQVSNLGNVKSLDRYVMHSDGGQHFCKGKILSKGYERGYWNVNLWVDNLGHTFKVHRLVANAFIPNPLNLPHINHKDEDKANSCMDNLEWCTAKYNHNYNGLPKRIAEKIDYKEVAKKNSKKVYQYDKKFNILNFFNSAKQCEEFGYNSKCVTACCRFEKRTYKGYIWSYTMLKEVN